MFGRRPGPGQPLPEHDRLELAGDSLDYRIRSSARRRTLSLRLEADGALTVSTPHTLSLAAIREFVAAHRGWIGAKRVLLAAASPPPLALADGAMLPYLGGHLNIQVIPRAPAGCRRDHDDLVVHAPGGDTARHVLETWWRREAARHFASRVAHYAAHVGRAPRRISVRAQRRRWGSCTSRGTVSLNWRLMQATPEIVDYVVVHELCHLLVPNHSPRFWAEVARVLPDWRERRRALRRFRPAW